MTVYIKDVGTVAAVAAVSRLVVELMPWVFSQATTVQGIALGALQASVSILRLSLNKPQYVNNKPKLAFDTLTTSAAIGASCYVISWLLRRQDVISSSLTAKGAVVLTFFSTSMVVALKRF
jgi:hypothetical protein